jgi:hypothetical protein
MSKKSAEPTLLDALLLLAAESVYELRKEEYDHSPVAIMASIQGRTVKEGFIMANTEDKAPTAPVAKLSMSLAVSHFVTRLKEEAIRPTTYMDGYSNIDSNAYTITQEQLDELLKDYKS